ncbi:hypothetical protein HQ520_09340 [bacterium]|nr:hypothetical protein [bacterium]
MQTRKLEAGNPVLYQITKTSEHPGPRAQGVDPAPHGDTYTYQVEKYWRVKKVLEDGRLVLVTRRGKEHVCDPADPQLHPARLLKRVLYRNRFPDKV